MRDLLAKYHDPDTKHFDASPLRSFYRS
jgi:hypothetical protein